MSQDDLGKAVGISQVSIKKIESGGNTRHGRKIAEALKTTLKWLETGNDPRTNEQGDFLQGEDSPALHVVHKSEFAWPFKRSTPERIGALTQKQLEQVDVMIDTVLRGFEADAKLRQS